MNGTTIAMRYTIDKFLLFFYGVQAVKEYTTNFVAPTLIISFTPEITMPILRSALIKAIIIESILSAEIQIHTIPMWRVEWLAPCVVLSYAVSTSNRHVAPLSLRNNRIKIAGQLFYCLP